MSATEPKMSGRRSRLTARSWLLSAAGMHGFQKTVGIEKGYSVTGEAEVAFQLTKRVPEGRHVYYGHG